MSKTFRRLFCGLWFVGMPLALAGCSEGEKPATVTSPTTETAPATAPAPGGTATETAPGTTPTPSPSSTTPPAETPK